MLFKITLFMVPLLALLYVAMASPTFAQAQLASVLEQQQTIDVTQYLVSEKFDGVRAIWTGSALITRQGNPIHAPDWFTATLPKRWLDGELWIGHQQFEAVSAIARTQVPDDAKWRQVHYLVFDMPDLVQPFAERYSAYRALIADMHQQSALKHIDSSHIQAVEQLRFHQRDELDAYLAARIDAGAEGLMLHHASAFHQVGRSQAILKLKPHFDAEAEVIGHLPGRGKYTDMLGALRVRNTEGHEFSIGTGFSDAQRADPPPIGSVVTYKYHGYTNSGLPRFASFLRVRND